LGAAHEELGQAVAMRLGNIAVVDVLRRWGSILSIYSIPVIQILALAVGSTE